MTRPPVYLDASALVKLVWREPESDDLADWLSVYPHWFSSVLLRVEVVRAARRVDESGDAQSRAERYLGRMTLVRIDDSVIDLASGMPERHLRSLDAIHLATALTLGDLPEALVTYDKRLADAARRHGLTVVHPGANVLTA